MTHKFEIKEEIEVTFPHFRKYEFFYYKIVNPEMEIRLMYCPSTNERLNSASISYDGICEKNTFRHGSYEITEEEFNITYDLAFDIIHSKHTK